MQTTIRILLLVAQFICDNPELQSEIDTLATHIRIHARD